MLKWSRIMTLLSQKAFVVSYFVIMELAKILAIVIVAIVRKATPEAIAPTKSNTATQLLAKAEPLVKISSVGFQGRNCEFNINNCRPNPCQNEGTCHDLVNGVVCSCPPGTAGYMCDINHDDCYPEACHNNGTCIDKVGGFDCKCPPGFVGPRCEGDINECLSNPCHNFGTLDWVQLVNNYHCNCKPGKHGKTMRNKSQLLRAFYLSQWRCLFSSGK